MTMQNWVDRMIYLTFCAARYNNNNSNSHKSNNNKDRCCCCCLVYVACGLKFQLTTTTRTTTSATATWVYRQNQSWPKGKPKRGKLVSCCSRERKTLIKINNAKGWVKCAHTQTHTHLLEETVCCSCRRIFQALQQHLDLVPLRGNCTVNCHSRWTRRTAPACLRPPPPCAKLDFHFVQLSQRLHRAQLPSGCILRLLLLAEATGQVINKACNAPQQPQLKQRQQQQQQHGLWIELQMLSV